MAAVTMSMAAVKPAVAGFSSSKSAFKGSRVAAVAPKKVAGGRASLQVRQQSQPRRRVAAGDGATSRRHVSSGVIGRELVGAVRRRAGPLVHLPDNSEGVGTRGMRRGRVG